MDKFTRLVPEHRYHHRILYRVLVPYHPNANHPLGYHLLPFGLGVGIVLVD